MRRQVDTAEGLAAEWERQFKAVSTAAATLRSNTQRAYAVARRIEAL